MSVLSDSEILEYLQRHELVIQGSAEDVGSNSYEFRSGQILPAGADDEDGIRDWSNPQATDEYVARPGGMFWVRTSHEVYLPNDICAFWWQTNSLSKKGIMLVNMSMVEPGYRGPLACLFVNFGDDPVSIRPTTTIAKLVFMKMDRPANRPFSYHTTLKNYDEELRNVSLTAPKSFLRVSEQAKNLEAEYERLKLRLSQDADGLKAQVTEESRKASEKVLEAFRGDLPGELKKLWTWLGFAAVVVAAGFAIFNFVGDWVRPKTEDRIKAAVHEELDKITNSLQKLFSSGNLNSSGLAPTNALAGPKPP